MKHVVPHGLGFDTAKKVAEAALVSYKERFAQYNPNGRWLTEKKAEITFRVKGISLAGALEVNERDIQMDLEVPFMLRPFKGKAIGLIEEEIKKWIEKAKRGEI
ncbi:MAG: polyhydroxyalkanoic acid system family protein [Myxococcales bacterium]|nr:polyhydroxyalkanoic acid system family protein [Myxococcales bacterium]